MLAGKLLPGMLPLILFVVVELIWGTTAGLLAALILGSVQLMWFWFREGRFDKFVLGDMGFLILLGGLALLFDNALLFKLKPVFVESALLLLIGYSAFADSNLVMMMIRRYFRGFSPGPFESWMLQQTLRPFFWMVALHVLITLIAAIYLPHAWWAAISGPGFYAMMVLMMGYIWFNNRRKKKQWHQEEWLPLVDEEGKVTGHAPRSLVHQGKTRWLHPVIHLHVLNGNGIWLQKRPRDKAVQPGKWDTAVGGHIAKGEDVWIALAREAHEEIGVDPSNATQVGRYLWRSEIERELVMVFALHHEGALNPHPEELDGGQTWSFEEIDAALGSGELTPNFEDEYRRYSKVLKSMV